MKKIIQIANMKNYVRPDALGVEFIEKQKTSAKNLPVVKVIETDIYPINHYFG